MSETTSAISSGIGVTSVGTGFTGLAMADEAISMESASVESVNLNVISSGLLLVLLTGQRDGHFDVLGLEHCFALVKDGYHLGC